MLGFGALSEFALSGAVFQAAGPSTQTLTPSLYTNSQTFYAATVTRGTVGLTAPLLTNSQTFYGPTVAQVRLLAPSLFTNSQTFYGATITSVRALTPAFFTNGQTFYSPTRTSSNTVAPSLLTNTQTFFAPSATRSNTLAPALLSNTQTFFAPAVTTIRNLSAGLFTNSQTFYGPTASATYAVFPPLYADSDFIFPPTVTIVGGPQTIAPSLFTNTNIFYSPVVADPPVPQPVLGGGSLVRPRKGFRPSILLEFDEDETLPDASASVVLAGLALSAQIGAVVASSPDPINARVNVTFTQIEAYMQPIIRAKSSWNDPSDEELAFILDFALD